MSDSTPPPNTGSENMPDGIPDPPSILPPPDKFVTDEPEKKSKKKKNQGRKHPTDTYKPLKNKKGCAGCCGCFAVFGIVILLALGGLSYWAVGPAITYERVTFDAAETTISKAPEKATLYIGKKITYATPPTEVEIAIMAEEIHITGDFLENVMLIGAKVFADDKTRLAKDLDVKAAEFTDGGITLKGKLTGRVGTSR